MEVHILQHDLGYSQHFLVFYPLLGFSILMPLVPHCIFVLGVLCGGLVFEHGQ